MAAMNPRPLSGGAALGTIFAANAPTWNEVNQRPNSRPGRYGTSRAIGFRSGPGGDAIAPDAAVTPAATTGGSPDPLAPTGGGTGYEGGGANSEPAGYSMGDYSLGGGGANPNPLGGLSANTQSNRDLADVMGGMPMTPEGKIEQVSPGGIEKGVGYDASSGLVGGAGAVNSAQPGDINMGIPEGQNLNDPGSTPSPGSSFDIGNSFADAGTGPVSDAAPDAGGAAPAGYEAAPGGAGVDAGGYGVETGGAEAGAGGEAGGGGCFISEAVASAGNMSDSGPELQTLRTFRDQVMMNNPVGQALVQQYEAIAPLVVDGISARPDAMQLFQQIKAQYIDPAVDAITGGHTEEALQIYAAMIAFVTPIAIESVTGPGGDSADTPYGDDQGAMDDLGTNAALMEHTPEMRTMATGDQQYPSAEQGMGGAQPPPNPAMGGMGQPPMQPTGGGAALATMFAPAVSNPPPQPVYRPQGQGY